MQLELTLDCLGRSEIHDRSPWERERRTESKGEQRTLQGPPACPGTAPGGPPLPTLRESSLRPMLSVALCGK